MLVTCKQTFSGSSRHSDPVRLSDNISTPTCAIQYPDSKNSVIYSNISLTIAATLIVAKYTRIHE